MVEPRTNAQLYKKQEAEEEKRSAESGKAPGVESGHWHLNPLFPRKQ